MNPLVLGSNPSGPTIYRPAIGGVLPGRGVSAACSHDLMLHRHRLIGVRAQYIVMIDTLYYLRRAFGPMSRAPIQMGQRQMNASNMAKWLTITLLVLIPTVLAVASRMPMPAYY